MSGFAGGGGEEEEALYLKYKNLNNYNFNDFIKKCKEITEINIYETVKNAYDTFHFFEDVHLKDIPPLLDSMRLSGIVSFEQIMTNILKKILSEMETQEDLPIEFIESQILSEAKYYPLKIIVASIALMHAIDIEQICDEIYSNIISRVIENDEQIIELFESANLLSNVDYHSGYKINMEPINNTFSNIKKIIIGAPFGYSFFNNKKIAEVFFDGRQEELTSMYSEILTEIIKESNVARMENQEEIDKTAKIITDINNELDDLIVKHTILQDQLSELSQDQLSQLSQDQLSELSQIIQDQITKPQSEFVETLNQIPTQVSKKGRKTNLQTKINALATEIHSKREKCMSIFHILGDIIVKGEKTKEDEEDAIDALTTCGHAFNESPDPVRAAWVFKDLPLFGLDTGEKQGGTRIEIRFDSPEHAQIFEQLVQNYSVVTKSENYFSFNSENFPNPVPSLIWLIMYKLYKNSEFFNDKSITAGFFLGLIDNPNSDSKSHSFLAALLRGTNDKIFKTLEMDLRVLNSTKLPYGLLFTGCLRKDKGASEDEYIKSLKYLLETPGITPEKDKPNLERLLREAEENALSATVEEEEYASSATGGGGYSPNPFTVRKGGSIRTKKRRRTTKKRINKKRTPKKVKNVYKKTRNRK